MLEKIGEPLTVISEEIGVREMNGGGTIVLIDPIDGSRNAIAGIPFYGTSLAVARGERVGDICMSYVLNLVTGLVGALVGSFLNVCIYRLPRRESIVWPGSHCPACSYPIAWYDNIPLASYLVLVGRCRSCSVPIPWRYPVVEGLNAAGYIVSGSGVPGLPAGSIGYIYLPALLGVALTSMFFARFGARLAHRLSPRLLKRLFALLLFSVGLSFLI